MLNVSRISCKPMHYQLMSFKNPLLWFMLVSFACAPRAQNLLVGDSLMILPIDMRSGGAHRVDTIPLQKSNDQDLVNRTWYLDQFYCALNDSISHLFAYGVAKVFLTFSPDWAIDAGDGCYGFGGVYRISKDRRILIQTAGSPSKYCWKDTLNACYQRFWKSFCPLLHESRYTISGDSLLLFFQTGNALLIDTSAEVYNKVDLKRWPVATRNPEESARWTDRLIEEHLRTTKDETNPSGGERDTKSRMNTK